MHALYDAVRRRFTGRRRGAERAPFAICRCARGIVFLCLLTCDSLLAEQSQASEAEIQRATALFAAGKYEQASAIIDPLRRTTPHPHLQVLFLHAQLARLRGDCPTAIDDFSAMLSRDPTLVRPRIDLGLTLWACGRSREAVAQLEQTLSPGLPRNVEVDVLRVANAMRSDIGGISLDVQIVRNSNPGQTTQAGRVNIQGLEYELPRSARPRSATGLSLLADARYPLLDHWRLYSATRLEHTDYPGTLSDLSYLATALGTKMRFAPHTASLEAGAHVARYQDRQLYHGAVWRIADEWQAAHELSLGAAIDGKQLRYTDFSFLDGWQYTTALTARYAARANLVWQVGASHVRQNSGNSAYAFRGPTFTAAVQYESSAGWLFGARFDTVATRYRASDPLFGERRVDHRSGLEVSIGRTDLVRVLGLTPVLVLGTTRSSSTIDLYDYRRNFFTLALRKAY